MSVNPDFLSTPTLERWANGLVRALPHCPEDAVKTALSQALGYPSWAHAMANHLKNDVDRKTLRRLGALSPVMELPPVATAKGWAKRMSQTLDLPVTQLQRAWAQTLGHAHWRGLLGALEQAGQDRQNPWLSASSEVLTDLLLTHWPSSFGGPADSWLQAHRFVPAFMECLVTLRDQGKVSFQDVGEVLTTHGTPEGLRALMAQAPPQLSQAKETLGHYVEDMGLLTEKMQTALAYHLNIERHQRTMALSLPDNVWTMGEKTQRQQAQLTDFRGLILVVGNRSQVQTWAQRQLLTWEQEVDESFYAERPAPMSLQTLNPTSSDLFQQVNAVEVALRKHAGWAIVHTSGPLLTDSWGGLQSLIDNDRLAVGDPVSQWLRGPVLLASVRVLPTLCGHCRVPDGHQGYGIGRGCAQCDHGVGDPLIMQEVMPVTPKIREHLRRHRAKAAEAHWEASGGLSIHHQLAAAIAQGRVPRDWRDWGFTPTVPDPPEATRRPRRAP